MCDVDQIIGYFGIELGKDLIDFSDENKLNNFTRNYMTKEFGHLSCHCFALFLIIPIPPPKST